MNRTQKEQVVESLREELSATEAVYLADFRGLTVEQVNQMRRAFQEAGCVYKVVKNTLLLRAVKGTDKEALEPLLKGPTGIAFAPDDPLAPAKVLTKFAKDFDALKIKGGFFDGLRTPEEVVAISKMPGKDELRSTLLATMLAVPQGFLRLCLAPAQRFLLVLQARKRQLEEG